MLFESFRVNLKIEQFIVAMNKKDDLESYKVLMWLSTQPKRSTVTKQMMRSIELWDSKGDFIGVEAIKGLAYMLKEEWS